MAFPTGSAEPLREVLCALLGKSGQLVNLTHAEAVGERPAELAWSANFAEDAEFGTISGSVASPGKNNVLAILPEFRDSTARFMSIWGSLKSLISLNRAGQHATL